MYSNAGGNPLFTDEKRVPTRVTMSSKTNSAGSFPALYLPKSIVILQ